MKVFKFISVVFCVVDTVEFAPWKSKLHLGRERERLPEIAKIDKSGVLNQKCFFSKEVP